jgi:transposase
MQVKTILNRIQKHRRFVYGTVLLEEQIAGLALTVDIAPYRRNRPRCAGCGQGGPVYDRLAPRRFEFVPLGPEHS